MAHRPAAVASAQRRPGIRRRRWFWEAIVEEGEVVVICPDCFTMREQRAIQAEKARVIRRMKRGLPL